MTRQHDRELHSMRKMKTKQETATQSLTACDKKAKPKENERDNTRTNQKERDIPRQSKAERERARPEGKERDKAKNRNTNRRRTWRIKKSTKKIGKVSQKLGHEKK